MFSSFNPTRSGPIGNQSAVSAIGASFSPPNSAFTAPLAFRCMRYPIRSVQEGQKITNVLEARTSTFLRSSPHVSAIRSYIMSISSALDNHSLGSKLDRLALSCAQPPLDLSIKNRIQITSDRSFNWCQESLKPSLFPASLNRHLGYVPN
eukprot:928896-Amorphochlora_amoeboformis.AAC.1